MDTETPVTPDTTDGTASVEGQEAKVAAKGIDPLEVIGRLQTRIASLEAERDEGTGTAREMAELKALIVRTNQITELTTAYLTDPDANPVTLATKIEAVKKQGDDALAANTVQQIRSVLATSIGAELAELGFKSDFEDGHFTDPRFEEGNHLWAAADKTGDLVGYHKASEAMRKAFRAIHKERGDKVVADKTKEAEQRFKVENGALAPTNVPGTPGGNLSLEDLTKPLPRDASMKQVKEREAELNAALGLHRR